MNSYMKALDIVLKKIDPKSKFLKNKGRPTVIKSDKPITKINKEMQSLLAPSGVDLGTDYICYGERNYVCNMVITHYPPTVSMGWASQITNIDGVTLSIHINPLSSSSMVEDIQRSMVATQDTANDTNVRRANARGYAQEKLQDAEELLKRMRREQESIYDCVFIVQVHGKTKEVLDTKVERVMARLAGLGFRVQIPKYIQDIAQKSVLPIASLPREIESIGVRNMPASTLAASYPFNSTHLNDNAGFSIGYDTKGNLVLVDIFKKDDYRPSSNMIITGKMGSGKSTFGKLTAMNLYALGVKLIIIDPSKEYHDLAKYFGGDIIDAGGGSSGIINPLQVFASLDNDEDDKEDNKKDEKSQLRKHFQRVKIFMKSRAQFSTYEWALIEEQLEIVYRKFGITYDTDCSKLQNEDYPTILDLYKQIKETASNAEEYNKKEWEQIRVILRSIAEGPEANLFCGHRTLRSDSDFILIDTSVLNDADPELMRAQYYLVMSWAWDKISENKEEKIVIADEAHILLNEELPELALFLKKVCKQARKFEGSICLITQEMQDFLHPAISKFGEGIVANTVYKMLMGSESHVVEALGKLFMLNEAEMSAIQLARKGQGLFIAGDKRLLVNVTVEPWELEIFGKGGGR